MADIDAKIKAQGDKIRELKAAKSAKDVIEPEVKTLLALKAEFKTATGQDWKPGMTVPETGGKASSPAPAPGSSSPGDINTAIGAQGDIVRKLKADKAAKPEIEAAVKKLLALKADFKAATGQDWKPGMSVPAAAAAAPGGSGADLSGSIKEQGDLVRKLKADKAAKPEIDEAVKKLLALKAAYKAEHGKDWSPEAAKTVAPPAPAANNSGTVFSTGGHSQRSY